MYCEVKGVKASNKNNKKAKKNKKKGRHLCLLVGLLVRWKVVRLFSRIMLKTVNLWQIISLVSKVSSRPCCVTPRPYAVRNGDLRRTRYRSRT